MKGFNKALNNEKNLWESYANRNFSIKNRPCIFLSHKREDKAACREIAQYLRKAEIDYYLDAEDVQLQTAFLRKDPHKITESIKLGISNSTHMLCVVSEKTYQSNWVPFEVGYGHSAIIDKAKSLYSSDKTKLAILTLKDLAEKELPSFMQVGLIIHGTQSLNSYIAKVLGEKENQIINERRIFTHTKQNHPLDNVLNWKL